MQFLISAQLYLKHKAYCTTYLIVVQQKNKRFFSKVKMRLRDR
jgi:hypothetical protein